MQGMCRNLLTLLLIIAMLSTTAFSQADKAILYPGQGVTLNGNGIQTSSAVLSGDKVQTASAGAQLTGKGLIAQVDPESTIQYGDVMILSCGGVTVSSDGNAVQASDTRVTPVNGNAKFQMVNRGGKLTVNVESGTVRVSGDQVTMLTAGQSTELPSADGCPVVAQGNPAPAAKSGKGKWILIGGAAGGATAAAILLSGRKPTSPAEP